MYTKRMIYKIVLYVLMILFFTYQLHEKVFTQVNNNGIESSDIDKIDKILKYMKMRAKFGPESKSVVEKMYPDLHRCSNKRGSKTSIQKGQYWFINNFIRASKEFKCNETITYTTHGEFPYLDNLLILVERWQGPISMAVYAPGTDLGPAIRTIKYLRNCISEKIKDFVTFHLFFDIKYFPLKLDMQDDIDFGMNCDDNFNSSEIKTTFQNSNGLLYPINVARNLARSNAETYFIFPCDIELYPSPNIIPDFLAMIERKDYSPYYNKRIFVLPPFEVKEDQKVPETKNELLSMLLEEEAILFHDNICKSCHRIPNFEKWNVTDISPELSVILYVKRIKDYRAWEPFYIGTKNEPPFDERLTIQGGSDKMVQAFALCLLDYEFHILNNAFLVHRPGIKFLGKEDLYKEVREKQNDLIRNIIVPEYKSIYGDRENCEVSWGNDKKSFNESDTNS